MTAGGLLVAAASFGVLAALVQVRRKTNR
jgi:hypothetical protein